MKADKAFESLFRFMNTSISWRDEKLTKHGLLGPSFGPSDEADIQFIGGFLKIQENWGQPGQKTPASTSLNSKWIEGLDSGLDLDI